MGAATMANAGSSDVKSYWVVRRAPPAGGDCGGAGAIATHTCPPASRERVGRAAEADRLRHLPGARIEAHDRAVAAVRDPERPRRGEDGRRPIADRDRAGDGVRLGVDADDRVVTGVCDPRACGVDGNSRGSVADGDRLRHERLRVDARDGSVGAVRHPDRPRAGRDRRRDVSDGDGCHYPHGTGSTRKTTPSGLTIQIQPNAASAGRAVPPKNPMEERSGFVAVTGHSSGRFSRRRRRPRSPRLRSA